MGNGMTKPEQVLGSEELLSEMRLYEINQCICDVGGEGGGGAPGENIKGDVRGRSAGGAGRGGSSTRGASKSPARGKGKKQE